MIKRIIPFPLLLLSVALAGCKDDSGTSRVNEAHAGNSPPEIVLAGTPMVSVEVGAKFIDPGFTATDLEDGDITALVVTDVDLLDTSREGLHKIKYQVRDSGSADAKPQTRVVSVVPASGSPSATTNANTSNANTKPVDAPATDPSASAATPLTADAVTPLTANDDYFVIDADGDVNLSVSLNDSYADGETVFEVVQYPSEGELVMEPSGAFIYHPNNDYHGLDTFTYEARQGASVQQATASIDVLPKKKSLGQGFTPIKPSADSKIIYISSSQGDDANDCETPAAPCQTLEVGLGKARAGAPDHVYLKRGDVWRGEKLSGLKSGRSVDEPAVVAFYGSGARPKIEHSDNIITLANESTVVKNLHIIGLHFDAYKMVPEGDSFTGTNEDHASLIFLANNENVLLEDNLFNYLEIVIQEFNNQAPKNFTLRRNIWTGAYGDTSSYNQKKRPSNIYAAGVDGLVIEENVFDYGGWNPEASGAAGNMYNHNLYLQASNNGDRVVVRNNIITRGSSHGVQMRAGGLAEDNFFGRNAIGLLIGYGDKPLEAGVKAHAINNVITEGTSMVKGDEPCSGENLCTPAQLGLHFVVNGNADWLAQGNIVHSIEESDRTWEGEYNSLVTKAFKGLDDPNVVAVGNQQSSWGSEVLDGVTELAEPGLTLGDYYSELLSVGAVTEEYVGDDNFDKFMNLVRSRDLQQWDEKLTAKAINSYIRAGFQKQ